MSSKPLPLSFARCLIRLKEGQQLNSSDFAAKRWLNRFYEDGIIRKRAAGNRRFTYNCPNPSLLANYLQVQYDIISLQNYIREFGNTDSDGESSLTASKSTKTFRGKSVQGFFIKALHTDLCISGKTIQSLPSGIDLFIHQPEKLQISGAALIVGVENPECYIKFERLMQLFPQKELVIIMRYMSNSPNKWLQNIPNHYLHFGDFDPAGLSIYIREYQRLLPAHRCHFFLPPNIEQLIEQYGLTSLYDQQIHLLKNINFQQHPELQKLVNILRKYRKGLEQERLLHVY